jgi:2-iminobutanoate/2-iminopropanoate deaminase
MSTIERFPTPLPVPFSKAVRAGGFLFLSGQLAMDAGGNIVEGDVAVQTRRARARRRQLAGVQLEHGRCREDHRLAGLAG